MYLHDQCKVERLLLKETPKADWLFKSHLSIDKMTIFSGGCLDTDDLENYYLDDNLERTAV